MVSIDAITTVVDLGDLRCPTLGKQVRRALAKAEHGSFLDVLCTDPLAAIDVPHLVAKLGYRTTGVVAEEDRVRISIWKIDRSGRA